MSATRPSARNWPSPWARAGSGKGVAQAQRAAKAAEKDLVTKQKQRATRTRRDALDRALVDLAGYYRDVLVRGFGAQVTATHPDRAREIEAAARDELAASPRCAVSRPSWRAGRRSRRT